MATAKEIVDSKNAQAAKYLKENNVEAFANLYAPDGKLMPPGQPTVTGRQEIKMFFQKRPELSKPDDAEIVAEEVIRVDEKTILERGVYRFFKGGQTVDEGKYVVINKNINDQWLWYIDIFNSDRS